MAKAMRMAMKKAPPPKPAPCNIETTDVWETTIPIVIINNEVRPNTFFSPFCTLAFSFMNFIIVVKAVNGL